jgi:hypothetical protein
LGTKANAKLTENFARIDRFEQQLGLLLDRGRIFAFGFFFIEL